jgi:hypothetical protein
MDRLLDHRPRSHDHRLGSGWLGSGQLRDLKCSSITANCGVDVTLGKTEMMGVAKYTNSKVQTVL